MAEVFLAMQEGIGGFEKLVVLKRIFRQFSEDENFVRMFLDEARLAASIRHQNVVQILDIGRDEDGFFIVMEYLSGETVAYLFEALRASSLEVPPPHIVCRIGAEIAAGLHHAHTATDAAGHPQPIVHRDVTPSNLIVCFNGVVKVVDFGVAKATLADGHTQVGALKGKMSYLAPEQIDDLPVDGRTDVFQLGICLHEMLTGKRLFRGDNDQQKMVAVMQRPIPRPSNLAPSIPLVLDDVVLWALERDPDRRPQSADLLRRELEGVLKQIGMTVSDHDLGEWMTQAFPERHAERLAMERECAAQMRSGRQSGDLPLVSSTAMPVLAPATPFADGEGSGRRTPTMATSLQRPAGTASTSMFSPRQGLIVGGVLLAFIAVVSLSAWKLGGDPPGAETAASAEESSQAGEGADPEEQAPDPVDPADPDPADPDPADPDDSDEIDLAADGRGQEPAGDGRSGEEAATFEVVVQVVPENARIELDGAEVGVGSMAETLAANGVERVLVISAEGHETETLTFVDAPPPEVIRLERRRRVRRDPVGPVAQPEDRRVVEDTAETPPPRKPDRKPRLTDNLDPWAD
jgi:tRNA A-37 threonylcarbamoyl transferase component Bud32